MKREAYQALRGDLMIMADNDIKPNFTQLGKKYGINRHTVSKYWRDGEMKGRKPRGSQLDKHIDLINEKLEGPPMTKSALFRWLSKKYPEDFTSYSTFAHFTKRKGIEFKRNRQEEDIHVRYETKEGKQLQVDWKEDLKLVLQTGEVLEFNLYSATFGYSRKHYFVFSIGKGMNDFIRCTLTVLKKAGGVPEEILTDNMAAITNHSTNRLLPGVEQFAKDLGVKIKRCKIQSPETKGKTESSNRFAQWLVPYNGELDTVEEVIHEVEEVEKDANTKINETTGMAPDVLFKREMEHLKPLPNKVLLDSYIENIHTQKVPPTLLVEHEGAQYSVPRRYSGKNIRIVPEADFLYLYHSTSLVTIHKKQPAHTVNYARQDYIDGLKSSIGRNIEDEDIRRMAEENLRLLSRLGRSNESE